MIDPMRREVKLPTYADKDGRLTCPLCGCQHFSVTHSYPWVAGFKKRRRTCDNCSWPVTTTEQVNEGV